MTAAGGGAAGTRAAGTPRCSIVFLDYRSAGRSDRTSPDRWTLENWADDLPAFCEALEIEKAIVYGVSFSAWVAMAYATRVRNDRRIKVFERLGGAAARDAAEALFRTHSQQAIVNWFRICIPLYSRRPRGPKFGSRIIANFDLDRSFDQSKVNFTAPLSRIACPTLVLAGEDDPMATIEDAEDVVSAIPSQLVRFERFENAGHGVVHDQPQRFLQVVRDFIAV